MRSFVWGQGVVIECVMAYSTVPGFSTCMGRACSDRPAVTRHALLQVTSMVRQAVRRAVLEAGPCLVEAMSLCQVAASSEALAGTTRCAQACDQHLCDRLQGLPSLLRALSIDTLPAWRFHPELSVRASGVARLACCSLAAAGASPV